MFKAPYFTADGAAQGERDLPDWLFDGRVNEAVMHQVVTALRANQRQGTAAAKNRTAVKGGSRKPWRQKGTGRARQGTIRAAQWVGGGRAFPPQPHSWRRDVPRKVRILARHSAFNAQADDGRIFLVEGLSDAEPKTRQLVRYLEQVGAAAGSVLLLTEGTKANVYRSSRNVPGVEVRPFGEESAYDVLAAATVVIEVGALEAATPCEVTRGSRGGRKREQPEFVLDEDAIAEAEAKADALKARMAERAERALRRRVRGDAPAPSAAAPAKQKVAKKQAKPAKAEAETAAKAPEAEAAGPKAAPSEAAGKPAAKESKSTAAADQPLPTVAELADFLAGIDSAADVEALRDRDSRKTAQPHYAKRLEELNGESSDG